MPWRRVGIGAAALGGIALAALLWSRAEPLSDRVDVGEASVAMLDTLRLDGRRVTASLQGEVQMVDDDGTAWVGTDDHAFAVRAEPEDSLRVEERVLVVGLVREGRAGRYLEPGAVTRVVVQLRPGVRRSGERPTVQPVE